MVSSDLPVYLKKAIVYSSTGKKPVVAPYSGAIFATVALSARDKFRIPGPKNSTNFPTTPKNQKQIAF